MIINSKEEGIQENYQIKMIEKNHLDVFLPINIRIIDNQQKYFYDISSKQPISRMFEGNTVAEENIRNIISCILKAISIIDEYMLDIDSMLLDPQLIYIDITNGKFYFTYYLNQKNGFAESMKKLFEYILEHLNHNDKNAVIFAYGIYHKIANDDFDFTTILSKTIPQNQANSQLRKVTQIYPEEPKQRNQQYQEQIQNRIQHLGQSQECREGESLEAAIENRVPIQMKKREISTVIPEEVENEQEISDVGLRKLFLFAKATSVIVMILIVAIMLFPQYAPIKLQFSYALAIIVVAIVIYKGSSLLGNKSKYGFGRFATKIETIPYAIAQSEIESTRESTREENEGENKEGNRKEENGQKEKLYQRFNQTRQEQLQEEQCACQCTQLLSEYISESENKAKLILCENNTKNEIRVDKFPFIIGSYKAECDYVIDNRLVSRLHLRFFQGEDDTICIQDMNSTNGTYINEECMEPNEVMQIHAGDKLDIADIQFLIKCMQLT